MLGVLLLAVLAGCQGQSNEELLGLPSDGSFSDLSGDDLRDTTGKASKLRAALSALQEASAAEAKAAAHEKQLGNTKLQEAREASEDAASFAIKASKLLNSETALKRQQVALPTLLFIHVMNCC